MYIIVAANTLLAISSNIPGGDWLAANSVRFAVLLMAIFPLCLTRSLSGLAAATSFCFGCIVVMSLLVVWLCSAQSAASVSVQNASVAKATSLQRMLHAVPIFATSLFGHMNFPRIYAELESEAKARADAVPLTAMVLLCALLLGFGLAGYAAFGASVQEDIVAQLAFTQGEGLTMCAVQALMLIFVILKTPLIVFPMRALVLAAIKPGYTLSDLGVGQNLVLTALLLGFVY